MATSTERIARDWLYRGSVCLFLGIVFGIAVLGLNILNEIPITKLILILTMIPMMVGCGFFGYCIYKSDRKDKMGKT